ncbi:MAG: hypothetical protein AAF648_09145 [Pseudomonadota bacterium]
MERQPLVPLNYHIDNDAGLITLSGHDSVDVDELVRCGTALLEDAAFDNRLPHLLDLREAHFDLTQRDATQQPVGLTAMIDEINRRVAASIAVIVPPALPTHQIAEIYRLTCQFSHAELFEDYDHALRWLIKSEFADAVVS